MPPGLLRRKGVIMAGIVGYGAHLPRHRIKVEEIAKVWGADAPSYKRGLMLSEKSVPPPDMDTITLSVEATRRALARAPHVDPIDIGAIHLQYADQPSYLRQESELARP